MYFKLYIQYLLYNYKSLNNGFVPLHEAESVWFLYLIMQFEVFMRTRSPSECWEWQFELQLWCYQAVTGCDVTENFFFALYIYHIYRFLSCVQFNGVGMWCNLFMWNFQQSDSLDISHGLKSDESIHKTVQIKFVSVLVMPVFKPILSSSLWKNLISIFKG